MTVCSKLASDGFGVTQDRHPSYVPPVIVPDVAVLAEVLADDALYFKMRPGAMRRQRPYVAGEFGDITAEQGSIVLVALLDGLAGRVRTLVEPDRLKRAGVTYNDRPAKPAKAADA